MMGEDFTEAAFCANHNDVLTRELHGHTWRVRIYWHVQPFRDARILHAWLTGVLGRWDCKSLEESGIAPATNYGVAKTIAQLGPELTRVIVWRDGRVPCGCEVRV